MAGRLAGEQRASASELGSSGFLRLIRWVMSVGLAELLLMADEEAAAAAAPLDEDDEELAAPLVDVDVDEEEAAPASPLLTGLI